MTDLEKQLVELDVCAEAAARIKAFCDKFPPAEPPYITGIPETVVAVNYGNLVIYFDPITGEEKGEDAKVVWTPEQTEKAA